MFINKDDVKTVAIVGMGVIGAEWAILYNNHIQSSTIVQATHVVQDVAEK